MNSTMATATIQSTNTKRVAFNKIPQAIAFAGVGGAIINSLIWIIGNAMGGMKVPLIAVPISSIVAVAIGGLVYAILGKLTRKPITIFTVISIIFLVFMAFGPYSAMQNSPMPGGEPFNMATFVSTELMHIVSGALTIYAFTRRARA